MLQQAVVHGLCTWHSDTLSAWTMILAMGVATKHILCNLSYATFLVWLHVVIHAPFSILYHTHHNNVVNDYSILYIMLDATMIYVSQCILHIGLSWNVPWQIKTITIPLILLLCTNAIEQIRKQQTIVNVKKRTEAFIWISILQCVPIMHVMSLHSVGLYILAYVATIYMYKTKHADIGKIQLSNALMHGALIINNIVLLNLVKR